MNDSNLESSSLILEIVGNLDMSTLNLEKKLLVISSFQINFFDLIQKNIFNETSLEKI